MGNVAGFLRTALGGATTTLAVVLAACGVLWSRALIRRAGAAGRRADPMGATETVELVAVALAAGLSPGAALAAVAPLAPPGAREPLAVAARRVRGGWTPGEALAGTGLQPLGEVLEATQRWGAPAQQALGALAADLRAQRRAAAEEAAERVQLLLVFPTTLLTLPAFVLGVVPPLLWGALRG
jgi:Flp pilus assembly protein TadB